MNRVRELELERSTLIDELMKFVKMGRVDYENDHELYDLCSKIDEIGGRLSQLGEDYKGGFEVLNALEEIAKNDPSTIFGDNSHGPTGIANPSDYMSIVQEDTDNDGDIDKVSIEEKNEED
jgi:hypothetical protein